MRKALLLFIILLMAISGATYTVYKRNFDRYYPVSYKIMDNTYTYDAKIEEADVLIIGDQFGKHLDSRLDLISQELSTGLSRPIKIYSIAENNEGIHRTLYKLKMIKKLPPIIIYIGGSSEFYENIFPQNLVASKYNFKLFKNDYVQSLLTLNPKISRILYLPEEYLKLTSEIISITNYSSSWFQSISEITYLLYRYQFSELIHIINESNSVPIIIPPAVSLMKKVVKVCKGAVVDTISFSQKKVKKFLESGDIKAAYNETLLLDGISIGNAQTKYLLGLEQLQLGKIKKSRKNLVLAKAIDCAPSGAYPIINQIMKYTARENNIKVIDFDSIVNNNLGRNELFITEDMPQYIYLEQLEKNIIISIQKALQL